MIFEFLFPIIGWLVLLIICFLVYVNVFYTQEEHKPVPGQALYLTVASFFWVLIYMTLSSIWSILYSLIDLKYPDIVGAVADYDLSRLSSSGVVYDTFAFPLAMTLVSAITACILAVFLIRKFNKNPELRPSSLYQFLRGIIFIGGVIFVFFGFVYVVYAWLFGNLPIALFYKGLVALFIVGSAALYFYLVGNGNNKNEGMISKIFMAAILLVTAATVYFTFQVIGGPAEARKYRIDNITLEAVQQVKSEIDNQDQNYENRITSLDQIEDDYVNGYVRKMEISGNPIQFSSDSKEFKVCANFVSDSPKTINNQDKDTVWEYKQGGHCFAFKHKEPYNKEI